MLLKLHRLAHWLYCAGIPFLPKLIRNVNRIVFSAVIPPETTIGKNVTLGYQGLGIVIHGRAVIEDDVTIAQGVTIGGRSGIWEVPVIKRGALIGAGAKILGPVIVGEFAQIGANAVVLKDIPAHAVAVGVPARIIKFNEKPA